MAGAKTSVAGAVLLACVACQGVSVSAEEIAPDLHGACIESLPKEFRKLAGPGDMSGSGPGGSWTIESGQMDGAGAEEVFVIVLRGGRSGEVHFIAEREGKKPERKKISLKGRPQEHVSIKLHPFMEGSSLLHVDADMGGQVLLDWNGEKLSKVWEVRRVADGERHWFEIEDLNEDGVAEVIGYFRRELDVFFTDEDDLDEHGGAEDRTQSSGKVDATGVMTFVDGRWKKSDELLAGLR